VVFIGFPTWGMKLPPPMKSFLNHYDLKGKAVIPFNTNDGYGIGTSFETVKQLCPNSHLQEGFTLQGGRGQDGKARLTIDENTKIAEAAVKKWLVKIKMINDSH
jgi:Flavodoxin